jgi:hypothetical protein
LGTFGQRIAVNSGFVPHHNTLICKDLNRMPGEGPLGEFCKRRARFWGQGCRRPGPFVRITDGSLPRFKRREVPMGERYGGNLKLFSLTELHFRFEFLIITPIGEH